MKRILFSSVTGTIICALFFLVSCSEKTTPMGNEAPVPQAGVSGCTVTGVYPMFFTDWKADILTVLNNCYTEAPDPDCGTTGRTVTKTWLSSFHAGCNYSVATINDIAIPAFLAAAQGLEPGGLRPLPTYPMTATVYERRECKWLIQSFNLVYNSSETAWELKVTYVEECCSSFSFSPSTNTNSVNVALNDPEDLLPYDLEIDPKVAGSGIGIALIVKDPAGNVITSGSTALGTDGIYRLSISTDDIMSAGLIEVHDI
ncbi:MAG: hypothetical protein AAGN35_08875 [Bacteroidota bacterium]